MKITDIETFLVPPRWLLVRVATDHDITGWGEATLEGRSATVAEAISEAKHLLIGADPLRIEALWQLQTKQPFYRGGPIFGSAVAGVDQALWDIKGKYLGVPVHQLLGGPVRERVRMYAWIGGDDPNEVAESAAAMREKGFTAVKLNAAGRTLPLDTPHSIQLAVERAAHVREAMGDSADFALDFHGRFTTAGARRLIREVEPLQPMFIEEPVLPEHAAHRLADITSATHLPIAAGERAYHRTDFLPLLQAGLAVAQPDLSHCGGISEGRRIADLADAFDVVVAPHCPLGPIALASCLQLGFSSQNHLIQEQSGGIHYNTTADILDYLVDTSVFDFRNGYCELLSGPGLGIEIDEAAVRKAATKTMEWRGPVWTHADGSFAEW